MKTLMQLTAEPTDALRLTALINGARHGLWTTLMVRDIPAQSRNTLLDVLFVEYFDRYMIDLDDVFNPFDDDTELRGQMRDAFTAFGDDMFGDFGDVDDRARACAVQVSKHLTNPLVRRLAA